MRDVTKWQHQLLHQVGTLVLKDGFVFNARSQSFYRKQEHGKAAVHLSFSPHHQSAFEITVDVAVRFDQVEDLVNEGNKYISKAEQKYTFTLGCELGNLTGTTLGWTIACEAEISAVADEIVSAVQRIAIPYLAHYSIVENAYGAIVLTNPSGWLHSPLPNGRCHRILAFAAVLKKEPEFDAIIQSCESFLAPIAQTYLLNFQNFAARIRARDVTCHAAGTS